MPYSNGNAEHNHFESALATFTRQYASTENRQEKAWRGWMDYLQHQYDLDRAKWVAALDFDFFGPDIVFLCGAANGYMLDEVSAHVQWSTLERTQEMADGTPPNHGPHLVSFIDEPSFWVWYFGREVDNREQLNDVAYVFNRLLSQHLMAYTDPTPSHFFDTPVSLRTNVLLNTLYHNEDIDFSDMFTAPVDEKEKPFLAVALCVAAAQEVECHTGMEDHMSLMHAFAHTDMNRELAVSSHMRSAFGWDERVERLPLGVVCLCTLLAKLCDTDTTNRLFHDVLERTNPALFATHYGEIHATMLKHPSGVVRVHTDDTDVDYGTLMVEHFVNHFNLSDVAAPFLRQTLVRKCENDPYWIRHSNALVSWYCQHNVVHEAFGADPEVVGAVFERFSRGTRYDLEQTMKTWWNGDHPKALDWFEADAREPINTFLQPYVEALKTLSASSGDSAQTTNAKLTVETFDASHLLASKRKLKM